MRSLKVRGEARITATPTGRYNRIDLRIYKCICEDASCLVEIFKEIRIDRSAYQEYNMGIHVTHGVFGQSLVEG